MRKLSFVVIAMLLISACGKSSGGTSGIPNTPQAQKKIQPGDSIDFTCPDSFNQTTLKILCRWDTSNAMWMVTVNESDKSGKQVMFLDNLVGKPHETESLHMILSKNSRLYARIIQIGESDALYEDGHRNLKCTFD